MNWKKTHKEVTFWRGNLVLKYSGAGSLVVGLGSSVCMDLSTVSRLEPDELENKKPCNDFSPSLRLHSILAISVATHEGISGMAYEIQILSSNIRRCQKHSDFTNQNS